jgi:anti-sigma-K factor RskA
MTEDEFALLSAGAALGSLSDADRRAFERALDEHPEWAAVADQDAVTAASLAESVDDVEPPASVRDDILARIDAMTDAAAPGSADSGASVIEARDSAAPQQSRRRRRVWFALAAALVLIAAIGVGSVITVQQLGQPPGVVALHRIEGAPDAQRASARVQGGGIATLHWSASVGKAVLVAGRMPQLAQDQTFELWYVRGTSATPAGTFDAAGDSTSALLKPGLQPGDVIAVTVERDGGSPTGQPTTKPIVAIPTS